MDKETKQIISNIMLLPEYKRKQIISILIASMLNELSNKEAEKTYNEIINKLNTI
jgi:phenylalanyl-tRNA synthetase beta subunit